MPKFEFLPSLPEYAETLFSWRKDPTALKYNPLDRLDFKAYNELLTKFGHDLSQLDKYNKFCWAVKHQNEIVGVVSIHNIDTRMLTTHIGYTVAPTHYNRGFGGKIVSLMVDKIFNETKIRKVSALVHIENLASQKILDKLGFKREGVLRQHFLINDQPVDEIYFGLLKNERL